MSTHDALSVRPVRFTDAIPAWRTVLDALGAVLLSEDDGWLVFQLGAGRLALHAAAGSSEAAGTTLLGLETSVPLEEAVSAAAGEGVPIELGDTDHGLAGIVTAADGVRLTVDTPSPNPRELEATQPGLAVMPVWHTTAGRVALDVLDGLGMRRRITLEDGTWADLTARGGGLHGVQPMSDVGTELAFELNGNLDLLLEPLTAAGVPARIAQEESGRVLRFADPDGGPALRVLEREPDLYSYALSEM
ncbi:hypothetical protein [Ornithinimicrobium pekingense]|uniref:VOC family protein n=1 Tax=Ornithinimicrobium pekingense TaxID=384677 RepID=A0ABQ2F9K6_9MICO|nr:hypothetical protein [Ornithinimicrobium pekingense]GGK71898.1 hypothetical protein GCM10011509_20620 [Ornithinimicrobium pekingense]